MSNLCSVLETLHKSPDSDLEESDDNNENDDPLNGSSNSRLSNSNSWRGSLQKLPTTPSTSESDLANLSADSSDPCRQCHCRGTSSSSRQQLKASRGRGWSRERGRGSDRESERESDRDSIGGYNSGYNSDRPPLPSRSLKDRATSRSTRSGRPSPTLTSSPLHPPHQHTSSLDTDCSSDQDKHSDSSAADVVSTGGLLRNKRTSRKSNKSVGFAEDPPQELPPPPPSPSFQYQQQHPPSSQPFPPPPPGPPSSPLPERTNLFRPISKPQTGPLKANHELLRLIPATSQANANSATSSPSSPSSSSTTAHAKDREFRHVRRPRARSSDSSGSRGDHQRRGRDLHSHPQPQLPSEEQTSVLSRVNAIEALNHSEGKTSSSAGNPSEARSEFNLRSSSISNTTTRDSIDSGEQPKETGNGLQQNYDPSFQNNSSFQNNPSFKNDPSFQNEFGRRKTLHSRPRSASVDRRKRNGLTVGVSSSSPSSLLCAAPISSGSSITASPSSTPSPGFRPLSPNFPPPPDSALPQYDEALKRIKLLRWTSLQQLPTSRGGVSGTCGGQSDTRNDSNEGSDDVFTSDDDVRPAESDVRESGQVPSSGSRLQSRKTSTSKRIVLEVLV